MDLTWYSAAGLRLREGDRAIAFDPFFGMGVGCFAKGEPLPLPVGDFDDVTDVFVTHGHVDHIYHLPRLCQAAPFHIHCTPAPRRTLLRLGVPPERMVPAAAGETCVVSPFAVTAYRGRHCRFDLPVILKTVFRKRFFRHPLHLIRFLWTMARCPEKGEILMYEVSCGGKRVQLLGSLGLDAATDYPTGADVLILPYQGRSDLETYALDIVRRLQPRAVLLDHYDDAFPPISDEIDTQAFIQILAQQEHIPCRAMEKGQDIHVETEKTLG